MADEKQKKDAKKPAAKKAEKAKKAPAKKRGEKSRAEKRREKRGAEKSPKNRRRKKPRKRKKSTAKPAPIVVRASSRYVRIPPRKARLIANQIRGMHIERARALLEFSPRGAASTSAS